MPALPPSVTEGAEAKSPALIGVALDLQRPGDNGEDSRKDDDHGRGKDDERVPTSAAHVTEEVNLAEDGRQNTDYEQSNTITPRDAVKHKVLRSGADCSKQRHEGRGRSSNLWDGVR